MCKFIILCSLVFSVSVMVYGNSEDMIGPGKFNVINIKKPSKDFKFNLLISQRKVNRTHDGFNAFIELKEDFDDSYGINIDISKLVDGGWKEYQKLADQSITNFVKKYAENNFKEALRLAGVDPPEFPIKKGNYEVNNFVFDYEELPKDCVYGEYFTKACILKANFEEGCVETVVEFVKHEDGDDE